MNEKLTKIRFAEGGPGWYVTRTKTRHLSQLSAQTSIKTLNGMGKLTCQGHTISQRLRKLKQVPPELIPLGKASIHPLSRVMS